MEIPCSKSHVCFVCFQRIFSSPNHRAAFRNMLLFYGEELLVPRPVSKPDNHLLLAADEFLYSTFAAGFYICRPSLSERKDKPCSNDEGSA
jgi:hypothetical protein